MSSIVQKFTAVVPWILLLVSYVFYSQLTDQLQEANSRAHDHKLKADE